MLQGYPALGTTVDKSFNLTVENTPTTGVELRAPESSFVWKSPREEAPEFLKAAQNILRFLLKNPLRELNGKTITFHRDWPLSEGLGSSSALFLGLALALLHPLPSLKGIHKLFLEFQKTGSGFDLLIQAQGGFLLYGAQKNLFDQIELEIPKNVLFFHTGKKLNTSNAIARTRLPEKAAEKFGQSVIGFVEKRDWRRTIDEHYNLLCELGVIPAEFINLRDELMEKGLIHSLKTTGAGGGDALLVLANYPRVTELRTQFSKLGFTEETSAMGIVGACP